MRSLLSFMCVSAVAGGLLVAACGNGTQVFGFEDEGALCVHSNEDGRLHTSVQFPPCLSSSCDHALETGCAIEVSGDEIIVTSSGTFESQRHGACTADCRPLIGECISDEPLAPGDYTLAHGESSAPLTLPADTSGHFPDMAPFFFCETP